MGYLTKYGSAWGQCPELSGNVYWVSPGATYTLEGRTYSSSDGNDGLSPERALATIAQATSNATANAGDTIMLLPGIHTVTGALAASKAGLTYRGMTYAKFPTGGAVGRPGHRPMTVILQATAATNGIACTAADLTWENITFRPITQGQAMTFSTAADRLTISNCMVDMKTPVGHANTLGIIAAATTSAPDGLYIYKTLFLEGNGGTSCGVALDIAAAVNFMVEGNTFLHDGSVGSVATWTTAVQARDNCQGAFRDNDVIAGGSTITNGFRGVTHTGAGIVQFIRNYFTVAVTNPITAWAASDVGLLNNYVATVAGGTGGTLISSST